MGERVVAVTTQLHPHPMRVFGGGHGIFQLSWRSYHASTTAWFGGSCERKRQEKEKKRKEVQMEVTQIWINPMKQERCGQTDPNKPEMDR